MNKLFYQKFYNAILNFCSYRFLSIFFLGFSAGVPLILISSVLSMWVSRIGIDIKTIGLLVLVSTPYSFKYLWSSIFDYLAIPYFSKKFGLRKSWLILTQICLVVSIISLGLTSPLDNITITALVALLIAFFSATQDIIIDALRIELLEKDEQGIGATMYVYGYRVAIPFASGGSLLLADYMSWGTVFFIMSLSIFIGIIATMLLSEPKTSKDRFKKLPKLYWSMSSILEFIKTRKWLHYLVAIIAIYKFIIYFNDSIVSKCLLGLTLVSVFYKKRKAIIAKLPDPIKDFCKKNKQWIYILLFIITYKLADAFLGSLQSKFYVDMGFSNSEIAYITKGLGFFMTLLGLFIGGLAYYRLGIFKSLLLTGILQMLSNIMFIWVASTNHDLVILSLTIAIENLTSSMSNIAIVAYLSSICNVTYAATQYALLSSFATFGRNILSAPAGYVVASLGWIKFFWITVIAGIPGIVFLYLIFRKKDKYETE